MSRQLRLEGIILKTVPFRDYDLILTVFSKEIGLCQLIAKGRWVRKTITTPLTRAEFVYTESSGDLYRCQEISPIKSFLGLRKSLKALEAGCRMLQALSTSQVLNKPAPLLYALLLRYLEKVQEFPYPDVLCASFLMKILRHDGFVDFSVHNPQHSSWVIFQQLAYSASFEEMSRISANPDLFSIAEAFFISCLNG